MRCSNYEFALNIKYKYNGLIRDLNHLFELTGFRINRALIKKTALYFNNLFKSIKIYIYARKKHSFTNYSASRHLKYNKFVMTDMRNKKPFFIVQHGYQLEFPQ